MISICVIYINDVKFLVFVPPSNEKIRQNKKPISVYEWCFLYMRDDMKKSKCFYFYKLHREAYNAEEDVSYKTKTIIKLYIFCSGRRAIFKFRVDV